MKSGNVALFNSPSQHLELRLTHQNMTEALKIALISIHGLFRGTAPELGRDADTGGQILYVLELAAALAERDDVEQVEIFTRRLEDAEIGSEYASPEEIISPKLKIVRLDCGTTRYLPKEQLWDYLDAFADHLVSYLHQQPRLPDVLHSHYADAGFVGVNVANRLALPLIHTGHSLGRVKSRRLLAVGATAAQLEHDYNMQRRIEAEETVLATADLIITSTHQEIEEQYGLYDHYLPEQMRVIAPGTDLKAFHPAEQAAKLIDSQLWGEFTKHLKYPDKPIILALSRPDRRKNITSLIEAYGQSTALQLQANLMIVAGNRDDIDDLDDAAREIFIEIFQFIDRYDLHGRVALPKHHGREQVPLIYRMVAATGGIFVNPALTEPFGLTLIEAAASGLPVVATEDGGPVDILANCRNGELIDPLEPTSITTALEKILADHDLWQSYRDAGLEGVKKYYSWQAHARQYVELLRDLPEPGQLRHRASTAQVQHRRAEKALVTDLDLSLIGDEAALQALLAMLHQHRHSTSFIIATGRRLDQALKLMKKHGIPEPDILITSSGTEVCYAPKLTTDVVWSRHIDHHWAPHKVREVLDQLPGLKRQPKEEQSRFKISYYFDPQKLEIERIKQLLHREELSVHVQVAFGQYLDILPQRASKGMAMRYVADRWQIPLEQIFVAGGSGADEDMMRGNTLAAVVANRHHEELSQLSAASDIYFAKSAYAAGIIEALEHYQFLESTARTPT